jgi:hypothetical protein
VAADSIARACAAAGTLAIILQKDIENTSAMLSMAP